MVVVEEEVTVETMTPNTIITTTTTYKNGRCPIVTHNSISVCN